MVALSLTLFAAAVAAEPNSHILSDTPSYLNRAPILASFFSVDVDRNATSSACSGRGLQLGEPRHECHCNPGYSGVSCEHPGAAWSSGRLALSHTAALVSAGGSLPKARAYHTLTPVGDRLYLFGGMTYVEGKAHRLNDLHYYNASARRWHTPYAVGHWPTHRTSHTTTLVASRRRGPRLFVFGGLNTHDEYCADLDVFSVDAQVWTRLALKGAPKPRARHAAVALGGGGVGPDGSGEGAGASSLWVFGGARYGSSLTLYDDVHILDAQHEPPVWYSPAIRGDSRPAARCGHSATLLADGQSVVVFGGDGGTSDPTADPVAG